MIDLTTEKALTLKAATKLPELERDGRRLHVATLHRWVTRGCRGVVLETVIQGTTRVTTREAIDRFFAALTEKPSEDKSPRTPARRKRESDRAQKELAKSGW